MPVTHQLHWAHGEATIDATAATVTDATFTVAGKPFKPFARAPWHDEVRGDTSITGHLRVLSGDFVGLPFGTNRGIRNAPADWQAVLPKYHSIHGPAADLDWTLVKGDANSVTWSIDYPAGHEVEKIERVVTARPDAPALDFVMRIFARRRAVTSVGLHPNFRFPDAPGRLHLDADFAFGLNHPGQVGPDGRMEFQSLDAVPFGTGTVDMSHVPLSPRTDKNVMLCGMKGPLTATWLDEGVAIELDWDRKIVPSLMIWHTDGGIGGPPWFNRFRGIGLEPIASAFDLPVEISTAENPINRRGVATAIAIDPATPLEIRHSIRAFAA
jgi:hypothetical protein